MTQQDFLKKAKAAAKEFAGKKKAPTTADKQFEKGALWAFDVLMLGRTVAEYEATLRQDVCDRFQIEVPEQWQELLISETAAMMADRDGMQADILKEGRLIEKMAKNMYSYKESNPLYVHLKELQRSIGMQREHLGLTAKSSKKMESPKTHNVKDDPIGEYFEGIK